MPGRRSERRPRDQRRQRHRGRRRTAGPRGCPDGDHQEPRRQQHHQLVHTERRQQQREESQRRPPASVRSAVRAKPVSAAATTATTTGLAPVQAPSTAGKPAEADVRPGAGEHQRHRWQDEARARHQQPRGARLPPPDVQRQLGRVRARQKIHRADRVEELLVRSSTRGAARPRRASARCGRPARRSSPGRA